MPAVVRRVDEAVRRSLAARRQLGEELRLARVAAGLSQAVVGRAIGSSAATISRVERGLVPNLTIDHVTRHAASVGLVLRPALFPIGSPIRDAGQLRILKRLEPNIRPGWTWGLEIPVASNDLRAFDAGAARPGCRVGFDVWARIRDVQAQVRMSLRKQADSGVDRLILVFGDGAANRRALRDAGDVLRRAFPLDTHAVLSAMREGRDPGANGIVVI
jgi:transcriptional regulator with XRE-family HTH domain